MKTIVVFGCSFSNPIREVSWPAEMALYTNDQYKIISCAKGGSNCMYSLYMLDLYLKNNPIPDLILFQFTTKGRVTWVRSEEFTYKNVKSQNKKYMNLKNLYTIEPNQHAQFGSIIRGKSRQAPELAKLYDATVGINLLETVNIDAIMSHVKFLCKDIPHLTLLHSITMSITHPSNNFSEYLLNNIDLIFEVELGKRYFLDSIIDNGWHLNEEALSKVGKIVYNKCIAKRLL